MKGQADSGRHNIVVERKREDGYMNECGDMEAIDLSIKAPEILFGLFG